MKQTKASSSLVCYVILCSPLPPPPDTKESNINYATTTIHRVSWDKKPRRPITFINLRNWYSIASIILAKVWHLFSTPLYISTWYIATHFGKCPSMTEGGLRGGRLQNRFYVLLRLLLLMIHNTIWALNWIVGHIVSLWCDTFFVFFFAFVPIHKLHTFIGPRFSETNNPESENHFISFVFTWLESEFTEENTLK